MTTIYSHPATARPRATSIAASTASSTANITPLGKRADCRPLPPLCLHPRGCLLRQRPHPHPDHRPGHLPPQGAAPPAGAPVPGDQSGACGRISPSASSIPSSRRRWRYSTTTLSTGRRRARRTLKPTPAASWKPWTRWQSATAARPWRSSPTARCCAGRSCGFSPGAPIAHSGQHRRLLHYLGAWPV